MNTSVRVKRVIQILVGVIIIFFVYQWLQLEKDGRSAPRLLSWER